MQWSRALCALTFDMSGDRRHTKCAVGRPLDGGVRQRSLHDLVFLMAARSTASCFCCAARTQALTHAFILMRRALSAKLCLPALTRASCARQRRWPCAKARRLYALSHCDCAAGAMRYVRRPCNPEAAAPFACARRRCKASGDNDRAANNAASKHRPFE
jgi:hypothetical protein